MEQNKILDRIKQLSTLCEETEPTSNELLNMDKLNGVNFDKGCFIGQEVTARMHYRNSVKKNAYTIEANQKLQSQNEITNSSGRVIATLTSAIDNIGIAIIRNQHINEDLYIGKNKINILNK